jgi:hypothetical protein
VLIQSQIPARPVFLGILPALGSQHRATGCLLQALGQHPAGVALLMRAEGVGQPFRRFGAAVGEGRFGANPDGQIAALEQLVVGADGLFEGRQGRLHRADTVWEQTGTGL